MKNVRLYHFQDITVARVARDEKFQTLSFSRYQGCECCKDCKVSYFIILRISRLRGLQRLPNFRLYNFQDIKVARVPKFQNL